MKTRLKFAFALLLASVTAFAQSKELRLLSSNGVKAPLNQIIPKSEQAIGAGVNAEFNTGATLFKRIQAGEPFDVTVMASDALDQLIKDGKVAAATRKDVAKVGIGVGFRWGQPKPDVRSPEALRKTLLAARAVTFNRIGASAKSINDVFEKLEIAEQMKPKLVLESVSGMPQENVIRGKADIVITLMPEMLWEGLDIAGPLPESLQTYIPFTAAVSSNSTNVEAGKAFIQFITASNHAEIYKSLGLEQAK